MREKSPFSVGRLPLKTASPWRLGGLAALVPGILAARAPAFVKSAGPGAIPGKIGQVHSIGGGGQGVTPPSPRCFRCSVSSVLAAPHRLH